MLMDLTEQVRQNTDVVLRLETKTSADLEGLSRELSLLRETLKDVSHTQRDHAERLTASEIRMTALYEERVNLSNLRERIGVLEEANRNRGPINHPWTAVVSAVVAVGALAWTLLGK